jgi:hypothetical protein
MCPTFLTLDNKKLWGLLRSVNLVVQVDIRDLKLKQQKTHPSLRSSGPENLKSLSDFNIAEFYVQRHMWDVK